MAPRLALALALGFACAATSTRPHRDATSAAVGVHGWSVADLGPWRVELPAEAFGVVEVRWRRPTAPEERAELRLSGAPLGATLEALADEEGRSLAALEPGTAVSITRTRWLGVEARRVTAADRAVLIAMRNPWRVARLFVRGDGLQRLAAEGTLRLAGLSLDPRGWALQSARFEAPAYIVHCERGCRVEARPGASTREAERVHARVIGSFVSERRPAARSAH